MTRAKRRCLTLLAAFVLVFLGCAVYVNVFASRITDGPLATAAEATNGSWTACVESNTGEVAFFGSNTFPSNSSHSRNDTVTITSIKPVKLPFGLKQVGMGAMEGGPEYLGGSLKWVEDHSSYPIQKLPVTLILNKNHYQPVITVEPLRPGVYTIPGLIVTYTDHGRTYSDYFPGQFILTTNSACPSDVPITPKMLPGMLPTWLAWMRVR